MDIPLSADALDVSLHPGSSSSLLAAGLISGKVQLIDFGESASLAHASDNDDDEDSTSAKGAAGPSSLHENPSLRKKWTKRPSHKSCRGVAFNHNGNSLFSTSKDGSIFEMDTESGDVVTQWTKAHDAAPSRILTIENGLLITGDDDGVVSLWDPRRSDASNASSAIRTYTHHYDWITSMLWCSHLAPQKHYPKDESRAEDERQKKKRKKQTPGQLAESREQDHISGRERLVVTSGDGTLSVIDLRAGKSGVQISEDQEDELLSVASVKNDSKLVVGTQLGILSLWAPSKGVLDHVDRIPGHPASVDAMCALDEDTILTGSSDGLVRVVQILPHKLLGIVADHGGMPVERIVRRDNWLASIGHGAEVKLTNLADILEDGDEDVQEEDEDDEDADMTPLGLTSLIAGQEEEEDEENSESSGEGGEGNEQAVTQDGAADSDNDASQSSEEDDDEAITKKVRKTSPPGRIAVQLQRSNVKIDKKPGNTASDFFADL